MTINLDAAYKSIIKNAIVKKTKILVKDYGDRKLQAVRAEAKEWKLDVWGWLSKTGKVSSWKEEGISVSGPKEKTGQLRRAAGHYRIEKTSTRADGSFRISTTTIFQQVRSYSKGQSTTYNYSNILDESSGQYYSGYKTRYRNILYKRLKDILHGNL